jgi:hypothetical protein
LIVLAGVALAVVGFRVLVRVYVISLRELERNAHLRRKEYFWHDLAVRDAVHNGGGVGSRFRSTT